MLRKIKGLFGFGDEQSVPATPINLTSAPIIPVVNFTDENFTLIENLADEALSTPPSAAVSEVSSETPAAPALAADEGVAGKPVDAIGAFMQALKKARAEFEAEQEKWEAKMNEIMLANPELPEPGLDHSDVKDWKEVLAEMLEIRLKPAYLETDALEQAARDHVEKLVSQLNALQQKLQSASENDKAAIRLQMANLAIAIAGDMVRFSDELLAQIDLCLKDADTTAKIAEKIVQYAITLLTGFPMPDIQFNLGPIYRKFLAMETGGVMPKVEQLTQAVDTALERAREDVNTSASKDSKSGGRKQLERASENVNSNESGGISKYNLVSFPYASSPNSPVSPRANLKVAVNEEDRTPVQSPSLLRKSQQ